MQIQDIANAASYRLMYIVATITYIHQCENSNIYNGLVLLTLPIS